MRTDPPQEPPYIDWRLDAWKMGALVLLFLILVALTFWGDRLVGGTHAPQVGADADRVVLPGATGQPPAATPTPFGAGLPAWSDATPIALAMAVDGTAMPGLPDADAPDPDVLPGETAPGDVGVNGADGVPDDADDAVVVAAIEIAPVETAPVETAVAEPQATLEPTAEPTLTSTLTPTPEPTPEPSPTFTPEPSPTFTPEPSPTFTPEPTPTVTPEPPTPEPTLEPVPEATDLPELPDLPLTLSNLGPNSVVPQHMVDLLEGTGAPGRSVEVRVQHVTGASAPSVLPVPEPDFLVGVASIDANGRWRLAPEPELQPGQNVITLRQVNAAGGLEAVTSPVVVNVLASGEQGPLSLVTPSIFFPGVGSRLRSGPVIFQGAGLPGIQVRLYLNNEPAGETFVTTQDEWRLTIEDALAPGPYVARAAAVNPQGEIMAESAPVAFVVLQGSVDAHTAPPGMVLDTSPSRLPDTMQISLQVASTELESEPVPSLTVNEIGLNEMTMPHCSVVILLGDIPLRVNGVALNGGDGSGSWGMTPALGAHAEVQLAAVSGTSEVEAPELESAARQPVRRPVGWTPVYAPVLLSPVAGLLQEGNPPVIVGLAQPHSEVLVSINGHIGARLTADRSGQWAFRPVNALPVGEHRLTIFARNDAQGRLAQVSVVVEVR